MIRINKIGEKYLSGNDNISNKAHYVESNITFFKCFFLNAMLLFLIVDKYHPYSATRELFRQGGGKENIKYKFRFAPKVSNICIN